MSDDFLSDISSAVDNAGQTNTVETITNPKEEQQPQQNQKLSTDTVVEDLTNMFDDADPHKNEVQEAKSKSEEKETVENTAKETQENKEKETQETKTNEKVKNQNKQTKIKYLDTYLQENDKGDLVNNDGEIIALAGKSRAMYEGVKNEGRKQRQAATDLAIQNAELARKFKEIHTEFTAIQKKGNADPLQSVVKETGLSENDAQQAMKFMKLYSSDPIQALKNILTQAQISGIDISKIGANITADPSVIRATMQELLAENKAGNREAETSQELSPEQLHEEAVQEATQFLNKHPEAEQFTDIIADAKNKYPDMSLEEIWLRIRREFESKEPQKPQNKKSDTKHYNNPKQKQPAPQRKVDAPVIDYANMSFDQIAKTIEKELSR